MYYLGGGSTHDKLIFVLKEEYAKIGKRISFLVLGRVINKFYFYEKDNYKRYGYSFSTKDKNKIDVFEKGGRDFIVVNKKYSFVVLNPMKPLKMQLTKLTNLRKEDLIFKDAKEYQAKNFKLKYHRMKIETTYPNSKKGALVIETPFLFSFGVNERLNQETNQLAGYSIPVCLWQREEEPTTEEKEFFEGMNILFVICQNYLEEEYCADMASHLSNIFYFKQIEYSDKKGKTKKKRDETVVPVLYAKLIYSDKSKKILSLFRSKGNDRLNPFDCLEQYCKVKMALTIESIYLTKKCRLSSIKANEVYVKPLKPREALLTIKESDDDESEEEEESTLYLTDIEED